MQAGLPPSDSDALALRDLSNHIRSLPIKFLDLRANKLVALPASIGELPALEKLDVRWNTLGELPRWTRELEVRGCVTLGGTSQ